MTTLSNGCQLTTKCVFFSLLLLFAAAAWGQSGPIQGISFGMQCGGGNGCPGSLPNGNGVPHVLRLWDSEVNWSYLNPSCANPPSCTGGTFDFSNLDGYLDAIANDPSITGVIYTFGWVPCWAAGLTQGQQGCGTTSNAPNGTAFAPTDLGSNGSVLFNNFVSKLTTHCSPSGNCVAKLIKYYELWNEANSDGPQGNWYGINDGPTRENELWEMVKPAAGIINANVLGAQILTPSVCDDSVRNTCTDHNNMTFRTWQQAWLKLEGPYGSVSNISSVYNFHVYLDNDTPENSWLNVAQPMLAARNNPNNGWTTAPWSDTETNFNGNPFACTSSADDCAGQIVRWQLLHASHSGTNLSANLSWYKWVQTIQDEVEYATAYKWMMTFLTSGQFTAACAKQGTTMIWTCPFTDANGNQDRWVWTTDATAAQLYNPNNFGFYWSVAGNGAGTCQKIQNKTTFTVTVDPYLLVNSCTMQP